MRLCLMIEGQEGVTWEDWVRLARLVEQHGLEGQLTLHARRGAFPVVQRFVPHMSRKLCCFATEGEVVAVHEWRLIRTYRGFSVFRETTSVSADLYGYAESMLGALAWEGVGHLEFKVSEHDGDVRYIETNARPWATIESSVAAGWDFPVWMHDYFLHGRTPVPPPSGHAVGKRARWHFGDLQALVWFLRGGEQPGWTDRGRSRGGALYDYLTGFSPRIHPDVFRLDDPLPELAEHARGARAAAVHVLRKVTPLRRLVRALRGHPSRRGA